MAGDWHFQQIPGDADTAGLGEPHFENHWSLEYSSLLSFCISFRSQVKCLSLRLREDFSDFSRPTGIPVRHSHFIFSISEALRNVLDI